MSMIVTRQNVLVIGESNTTKYLPIFDGEDINVTTIVEAVANLNISHDSIAKVESVSFVAPSDDDGINLPLILRSSIFSHTNPHTFVRIQMKTHGSSLLGLYGLSLSERVRLFPKLFFQMFSALDAIHSFGFVHGDVKSSNVLYDGEDFFLCDMGSITPFGMTDFTLAQEEARPPEAFAKPYMLSREFDYFTLCFMLGEFLGGVKELDFSGCECMKDFEDVHSNYFKTHGSNEFMLSPFISEEIGEDDRKKIETYFKIISRISATGNRPSNVEEINTIVSEFNLQGTNLPGIGKLTEHPSQDILWKYCGDLNNFVRSALYDFYADPHDLINFLKMIF